MYVNYSLFSNDKLNATKANGGICHGKVTYEFDVRIGELDAEGDYSTDTGVFIYGYNAGGATDTDKYKRLVALPFKHSASQTSLLYKLHRGGSFVCNFTGSCLERVVSLYYCGRCKQRYC
ncbi:MAG: hypothetical protein L6V93_17790 [Clostridiales bacterium]|nr:MAG: hypothetical protein L6V93_17790 [Clostridiales bacterium]